MKSALLAAALSAVAATAAVAAPEKYVLDSSHSQIVFSYNHLGFSTGYGMFSGFEGEIMFDQEDPANSSVSVAMPVTSMLTGAPLWSPGARFTTTPAQSVPRCKPRGCFPAITSQSLGRPVVS